MFHCEFLNNKETVSPSAFKVTLVWPLKLVGVIVCKFVPEAEMFINVLICPSEPSANEIVPVDEAPSISVIAEVTFATCD